MEFISTIKEFFANEILFQLAAAAFIIIVSIILAKIFSFLIKKIIRPFVEKTESNLDNQLLDVSESAIFRLLIIGGIYLAFEFLKTGYFLWYQTSKIALTEQYHFLRRTAEILEYLLFITLIIILLLIIYRSVTVIFDWYAEKINAEDNRNLSGSLFPLLKKVSKIIFGALAIVIILSKFNIDISAFVVSLGVGSLAIALAAQETLSNMISGFTIMIDRPFRIGDRIRYADTQTGDVVEIGIRSTKILDFDNNLVIIPNNEIVKSRIINITYPNTLTRVLIEVGVAYGTDIKKVREMLIKKAQAHPLCSEVFPPEVFLMDFGDSALNIRLVVKTAHYRNAFELHTDLREQVYELFNQEGIEIPFPQRVIHSAKEKNNQ
jgi:MscS family membrane protein